MINESKLKSNELKSEVIIWLIIGPIMLLHLLFFGFGAFIFIPVCIAYGIMSMLLFLRTLNFGYFIKILLFSALMIFIIFILLKFSLALIFFAGVWAIMVLVTLVILILNRYYKWKTTELFELAARPVKDIKNGFTNRPLPTGKLDYQWNELVSFSNFIRSNLISVVYYEKDKIVFGLNHSRIKLALFSKDYAMGSWVSFDRQGNVSVHISADDYQQYRDAYAFDQLCENLGKVYREMFVLYRSNRKKEILQKLNVNRVN